MEAEAKYYKDKWIEALKEVEQLRKLLIESLNEIKEIEEQLGSA